MKVTWFPQPGAQQLAVMCPVMDLHYGGARGGGKTDFLIGDCAIKAETYGEHFSGAIFRRTKDEMADIESRARAILGPTGAENIVSDKLWRMPGGGQIRFTFLDALEDADRIQGWNLTYIGIDEAGNVPDPAPMDRLWASLRSARGVPVYRRSTSNPGGEGHLWVKQRYISLGGWKVHRFQPDPDLASGIWVDRVFIPARLEDNKILLASDPGYPARVAMVGDKLLARAWRTGDWDLLRGSYFSFFNGTYPHVQSVPKMQPWWPRYLSCDWGFSTAGALHWGAWDGGTLWIYRELTISGDTPEAVGRKIVALSSGENISAFFLSHDAFELRTSPRSIAQEISDITSLAGIPPPTSATYDRVNGAQLLYQGLVNGSVVICDTCETLIATLPTLQRDPRRPEEIRKNSRDHWFDSARYMVAGTRLSGYGVEVPREMEAARFLHEASDVNEMAMRARMLEASRQGPRRLMGRGRAGR